MIFIPIFVSSNDGLIVYCRCRIFDDKKKLDLHECKNFSLLSPSFDHTHDSYLIFNHLLSFILHFLFYDTFSRILQIIILYQAVKNCFLNLLMLYRHTKK